MIGLVARDGTKGPFGTSMNAEELESLAATATQLAQALRQIAAEQSHD